MRAKLALVVIVAVASIAACSSSSSDEAPLAVPDGCQPLLDGKECLLPYPSDHFLVADATMPSGHRVVTRGAAKLVNDDGVSADVTEWRPIDGYSRVPVIAAVLPGDVTAQGFPRYLDPLAASQTAASPTILLDTSTGELVPHYADVDPHADGPGAQAIVLHPLVVLKPSTRYVVALHGVRGSDGATSPPGEGFRRLRDKSAKEPALVAVATRFESDVFAPLEGAGIHRAELQLAWDFTTTSGALQAKHMLKVRDDTIAWLGAQHPQVAVDAVEDDAAKGGWRIVRGHVTGPSFVASADPGAALSLDANGEVTQNGTVTFPFTAVVPAAVRDSFAPGRALAYGHGVFGTRAEVESASVHTIANQLHAVVFGIDWWGMSKDDLGIVLDGLVSTPSQALRFSDRVHQAMANWIAMQDAILTTLAALPELHRPTDPSAPGVVGDGAGGTNAGNLVYDSSTVAFLGISQGGILGSTLAALAPALHRVCISVGGGGISHMMFRSNAFQPLLGFLGLHLHSPLDRQKFVATLQALLDRIDPAAYASMVLAAPLPGSPSDRRVLMQVGLGDAAVPNPSSWLEASALGVPELTPNPLAVPGLAQAAPPVPSGITVIDFGIDPSVNREAVSFPDNPVHEGVRVMPAALTQMDHFLADGTIVDTCAGAPCRAP